MEKYLKSTETIDWNSNNVNQNALSLTKGLHSQEERVTALFYFVRDKIKYRNFIRLPSIDFFKASSTLKRGYGFCIPKAVLLASLSRAIEIPSRLHFADIRNHKIPEKLKNRLKTNLFTYHAYVELLVNNKWIKLTPALDIELCNKIGIFPVEFTGSNALFHSFDLNGHQHIEYISDQGIYDDLPYDTIITAFKKVYNL